MNPLPKVQDSERFGSLGSRQESFTVRQDVPAQFFRDRTHSTHTVVVYVPRACRSRYLLLGDGGTVDEVLFPARG